MKILLEKLLISVSINFISITPLLAADNNHPFDHQVSRKRAFTSLGEGDENAAKKRRLEMTEVTNDQPFNVDLAIQDLNEGNTTQTDILIDKICQGLVGEEKLKSLVPHTLFPIPCFLVLRLTISRL
jgi:hypothetical protein